MKKWLLKGCPHCGGDMQLEDGSYQCLQCGYDTDKQNPPQKVYNYPLHQKGKIKK
uniref:Viral late gene transcription factor 3 zinc ribbon domain-containing protein n=1 Tax=viral metagenome TaxID=1070528 RepID=A0A6M3LT14_9ZZZZ